MRKCYSSLKFKSSLLLLLFSVGCASSTLRVNTAPEGADVVVTTRDRTPVKLGKSPIDIDSSTYPELFRESVQVEVSKEGHLPISVVVPRLPAGGIGRINLNMQGNELPKVCQDQNASANLLAKGIADAASMVNRKRFDDATRILEDLAVKFGTVSVIHDLLGNVYFLQRNLDRALESYRRSNRLSPNNVDTLRMIERIEKVQGRGSAGV